MNIIFWPVMIVFMLLAGLLSLLSTIFWIWMLIDCLLKKFKDNTEKLIWTLVILFTGIIGALIYYFVVKRK